MSIRLLLCVVGDDHPKACTGRRLLHRGLVQSAPRFDGLSPSPIVLDPYARTPLSAEDRPVARRGGLLAVDCSWNRLAERGGFPGEAGHAARRTYHRRLPLLLAANPQHFGRLGELNTVEALAGGLAILGDAAGARRLLEGFAGGPEFLVLNEARLNAYAAATDRDGVTSAERALFGGADAASLPPAAATSPLGRR